MLLRAFPKLRILAVAAVFAGLPQLLPAQFSTPVPTISQPLTDNPGSAPVTTLDTDLITPYRTYTYDPTGSSIVSTGMSPLVDTTNTSSVRGETDTAIRDSSQTGQTSPYAAAASRLGLALYGDPASAMDNERSGGATAAVDAHFGVGSSQEDSSSDQSSWGTSSSFGPQPGASLRGARDSRNARLGTSQSSPSSRSSDSDLSAPTGQDMSLLGPSGDRPSNSMSGQRAKGSRTSARTIPGSTRAGTSSGRRGGESDSGDMASSKTSGGPSESDTPTTGEAALAFSPQSYKGYSFGESPFSSPGGNGELTFLNPNIFAAGSPALRSSGKSSGERRSTLRERIEQEEGLATGSTGYGLTSGHHGLESERSGGAKKKSAKNPYLVNEENPGNP